MGLSTPAAWKERHRAKPDRLGADGLRAYPRRVVRSLLALVDLPCSHHAPKILEPYRFSHSHSSKLLPQTDDARVSSGPGRSVRGAASPALQGCSRILAQ